MKKYFLCVFLFLISCKSKIQIAIGKRDKQIKQIQTQCEKQTQNIQMIKTLASQCKMHC